MEAALANQLLGGWQGEQECVTRCEKAKLHGTAWVPESWAQWQRLKCSISVAD